MVGSTISRGPASMETRWRPTWSEAHTAWLVTDACSLLAWFYLFVLNRTTIVRPYSGERAGNLIFVSNHQSPLDPFFICLAAFFPHGLWRPALHPWNLAAAEYWFRGPARTWLARHLRCIPLDRTRPDGLAVRRMCEVLPQGVAVFFPEGRRSADGQLQSFLPGTGYVAWRTRARIVPVALDGLLDALPYDDLRPRIGRRLRIAFGDQIDCKDLYAAAAGREVAGAIVERAMDAVRDLHSGLAR